MAIKNHRFRFIFIVISFFILSAGIMLYGFFQVFQTQKSVVNMIYPSNQTQYLYLNESATELTNKFQLNILIATPVDCNLNILQHTEKLQYNHDSMNIYWYFNIYNDGKCKTKQDYDKLMIQHKNIHIIKYTLNVKMPFWSVYLEPNEIIKVFNVSMDYIWLPDSDLMLEVFNFNAFIKISSLFNLTITQPTMMAMCEECRGSDWSFMNHNHWKNPRRSNGLIGYTVPKIENNMPLFPWKIWETLHPYIFYQYMVLGKDIETNWATFWWCGAVLVLLNTESPPCVAIYYTPIIHMDTKTMTKDESFKIRGHEMMTKVKEDATFAKFISVQKKYYHLTKTLRYQSPKPTYFFMDQFVNSKSSSF